LIRSLGATIGWGHATTIALKLGSSCDWAELHCRSVGSDLWDRIAVRWDDIAFKWEWIVVQWELIADYRD
jgi:hypothetical protein